MSLKKCQQPYCPLDALHFSPLIKYFHVVNLRVAQNSLKR